MSSSLDILRPGGQVAPGFERVHDAFLRNFEEHGDRGAACCVYRGGAPVVDLWAGFADLTGGRYWGEDTVQVMFSTTKGVTAICLHLLAQRRQLDLDAATTSPPAGSTLALGVGGRSAGKE